MVQLYIASSIWMIAATISSYCTWYWFIAWRVGRSTPAHAMFLTGILVSVLFGMLAGLSILDIVAEDPDTHTIQLIASIVGLLYALVQFSFVRGAFIVEDKR